MLSVGLTCHPFWCFYIFTGQIYDFLLFSFVGSSKWNSYRSEWKVQKQERSESSTVLSCVGNSENITGVVSMFFHFRNYYGVACNSEKWPAPNFWMSFPFTVWNYVKIRIVRKKCWLNLDCLSWHTSCYARSLTLVSAVLLQCFLIHVSVVKAPFLEVSPPFRWVVLQGDKWRMHHKVVNNTSDIPLDNDLYLRGNCGKKKKKINYDKTYAQLTWKWHF